MKSVYDRAKLYISDFVTEDVITTSAQSSTNPTEPTTALEVETDNAFGSYTTFSKAPGSWF